MTLDRQAKDSFDILIQLNVLINEYIYENRYLEIEDAVTSDLIFLDNSDNLYKELFYDEEFKLSATGTWDTTNKKIDLLTTQNAISNPFCFDTISSTTKLYKSATVSITGTGLDKLKFYIGEDDNSTITYTLLTLTGTTSSVTGSVVLSNNNKYGLNWKAVADGGTVVITQINIKYNR
jgi:hypothetical protein